MNEKSVLKRSVILFAIGLVIFMIAGLMLKQVSLPLGFLLGYIFNTAVFYVIIFTSDIILNLKRSVSIIVILQLVKLLIYAAGFILAIFYPKIFNLVGVFFGYMVIRLSIYVENYFSRGGEENG